MMRQTQEYSFHDDTIRNGNETKLDLYQIRNNQIQNTCQKYELYSSEKGKNLYQEIKHSYKAPIQYSLMYLPSKSLLYCWIHKAASTSWNKIFFDISHIRVREQDLHTAAQRFRPETDNIRELFKSSSLSFLFVRHPFERLVSAFVDKFETGSKSNWMYKMYAGDILNVTSDRGTPKDNAYLASMYRKLRPLDRPTFVDFVSYLLRTPVWEYNDHWAPYWLHCHLCGAHSFDVIGKFETIRSDTEYIREEAGLRIETEEFPWQNKKGSVTSVTSVSQEYFKQIDMESRRKLYEIYRIDFEMFDYSSQQYFTREE